jgi:hypothetical protein
MLNQRLLKELLPHLDIVFLENTPEKLLDFWKSSGKSRIPSLLMSCLGSHGRKEKQNHLMKVLVVPQDQLWHVVEEHQVLDFGDHALEGPIVTSYIHLDLTLS